MLNVTGNYNFRKQISHCKTKYVESQSAPWVNFSLLFLLQFVVLATKQILMLYHCTPVQLYNVSQNFDRIIGVILPQLSMSFPNGHGSRVAGFKLRVAGFRKSRGF